MKTNFNSRESAFCYYQNISILLVPIELAALATYAVPFSTKLFFKNTST